MHDDSVAPAFCDLFLQAPGTNEPDYLAWLLDTLDRHRVDLVIPGIEIDMYAWTQHVTAIQGVGSIPLLNRPELVNLCRDKWTFYECLKEADLPCAIESSLCTEFDVLAAAFGLPFLLKPRQGFGARGIVQVENEDTFRIHEEEMGHRFLAQPIVGSDDEEYTVSAFCDGEGDFYASMALRRRLSREGFTEKAWVVEAEDFAETISALCKRFKPVGPTNFQFRKCDDSLKLLEINPRISSSTSIRAAFGYNESAMSIEFFIEKQTPSQPEIGKGRAVRYTEEYLFHEDRIHR